MTRAKFGHMQRDMPELALAFRAFLLRWLSDRLILTDQLVAALSQGEKHD